MGVSVESLREGVDLRVVLDDCLVHDVAFQKPIWGIDLVDLAALLFPCRFFILCEVGL